MRNIWLVFKEEIYSVVWRKGFWLLLVLLPVGTYTVYWFMFQMSAASGFEETETSASQLTDLLLAPPEESRTGIVDHSGVMLRLPPELKEKMTLYVDEKMAAFDLQAGLIQSYFIVPQDFMESGQATLVRADFNPLGGLPDNSLLNQALAYNLLEGNEKLAQRVLNPMESEVVYLSDQPARDPGDSATFMLPYVVTMLYFFVIMGSASMMMSSVNVEKQSRMLEILLTSVTPIQMMAGKISALGLVGLFQTVVWSGAAYSFAFSRGQGLLPETFHLPPSILVWGGVYFLLGYTIYAALLGGLGALASNLRDASFVSSMIMLPTMLPMFFISVLIQQPNGITAMIFSFFPLTAPVTMMTRMAAASVPLWQHLVVVALLAGSAWLMLRSAAGMFRAQHLLSGQQFKIKLFFKALVGKA